MEYFDVSIESSELALSQSTASGSTSIAAVQSTSLSNGLSNGLSEDSSEPSSEQPLEPAFSLSELFRGILGIGLAALTGIVIFRACTPSPSSTLSTSPSPFTLPSGSSPLDDRTSYGEKALISQESENCGRDPEKRQDFEAEKTRGITNFGSNFPESFAGFEQAMRICPDAPETLIYRISLEKVFDRH